MPPPISACSSALHHLRIEVLLAPERLIQHQPRLAVAEDSEQRKRQLEGDLGALAGVGRELERVAQRRELLGHRQHRLGAAELQQDRQAIVLRGWLGSARGAGRSSLPRARRAPRRRAAAARSASTTQTSPYGSADRRCAATRSAGAPSAASSRAAAPCRSARRAAGSWEEIVSLTIG